MEDFSMKKEELELLSLDEIDYFDELPDPIVLIILNKIYDARTLGRCLAVSKRFATLIPEIKSICVSMSYPKLKKPIEDCSKSRNGSKSFFKNFVSKYLNKPISFLNQIILNNKKLLNSSRGNNNNNLDVFNWVGEVLKNFNDVESIELELPCNGGEIGVNKSMPLLKWEAGFGKGMEKCVILGATSILGRNDGVSRKNGGKKIGSCNVGSSIDNEEEQLFCDEELRLRIIWIISCLIASSGRHNLMKKMMGQCPKLSNAVISDAGKQGKLRMNAAQLQELRCSIDDTTHTNLTSGAGPGPTTGPGPAPDGVESTTSSQMGYVGNLVMKLWYVKELELPISGQVMKGATLVVIKPESKVNGGDGGGGGGGVERGKECDGVSLWGGFEGDKVFEEASKELLKRKEKRVYRLEVNSF